MKTALLLSGNPRTFEFCFPSVKKHILDVYNPDVFICTDSEKDKMIELYKPVLFDIRPEWEFLDEARSFRESMFGKIKKDLPKDKDLIPAYKSLCCGQMRRDHEWDNAFIYDVVISGRFDVKYSHIQPIEMPQEHTVYIPKVDARQEATKNGLTYNGYSAQLWWSSSKVADELIGSIFFGDRDYLTESQFKVNDEPERLLKYVCDVSGIRPEYVDVRMMVIKGSSDNPLAFDYKTLERYPEYL